jgi:hypothetical protein
MRERQVYGLEQISNNEQYMGIPAPLRRSHEDTQDQSQLQVRIQTFQYSSQLTIPASDPTKSPPGQPRSSSSS